jgi:superfamily II DNA or RNA helicase
MSLTRASIRDEVNLRVDVTRISLRDEVHLRVDSEDYQYLRALKENFTRYKTGYQFSQLYQSGAWDGRISVFKASSRTLPYGLLTDLIKFHRKSFPQTYLQLDPEVKALFHGIDLAPDYEWTLSLTPREYQEQCVRSCLRYSKGIFRVATAGGKSLILSYLFKILLDKGLAQKLLLIVPNKNLIVQFREDMLSYGIDPSLVGVVFSEEDKQWDRAVTISTWQSLSYSNEGNIKGRMLRHTKEAKKLAKKGKMAEAGELKEKVMALKDGLFEARRLDAEKAERLKTYDAVAVDEVHSCDALVLSNLLKEITNAKFRIGCTGTMPDEDLSDFNVRSYIGPVLEEYSAAYLREKGYIAECRIEVINLHYKDSFKGEYNEVKDAIFRRPFRLAQIARMVEEVEAGPVLLLVGKVETEGELLREYLASRMELLDREIVFLSGKDKAKTRDSWRKRCAEPGSRVVLIATYPIFQAGVNIPNLADIIFAAPFKSKIRVLQSIGRALRKFYSKVARIRDIVDHNNKFFTKHGSVRLRHYYREGFPVEDVTVKE